MLGMVVGVQILNNLEGVNQTVPGNDFSSKSLCRIPFLPTVSQA